MHRWIMALALTASLPATALAGGVHARIEGPATDGITYTARTLDLKATDTLEPWALAEGVVDGKRVSYLIRLKATDEHGVYEFERTWPSDGLWMVRLSLGHPPAPATVATLGPDGAVVKNKLYKKSDGSAECHQALKKAAKQSLNIDLEEGC